MSGEASRNALREELSKAHDLLALVMFSVGVRELSIERGTTDRFMKTFPKGAVVIFRELPSGRREISLVPSEVAKEMVRRGSHRPPGDEGINGSGPHGILRPL